MSPRRLYFSQVLMLLAVTTPIAIAEPNYLYLCIAVMAALIGWQRTIQQDRPLLGAFGTRAVVIAAFTYLVYEYFRVAAISVVALSHFMILVCSTKLLQRRTFRDDAQFFVLALLLLVVAAIISGNLLLPLALGVFLSVGLDALLRFHLALERARVEQRNRRIDWSNAATGAQPSPPLRTLRATALVALSATFVGTTVFLLCPRLAANSLFPRLDSARSSQTSGFSGDSLKFNTIGPIGESDRAVMRVQIEIGGVPSGELEAGPYFRGAVLTQYYCGEPFTHTAWEWRRGGGGAGGALYSTRGAEEDGEIELIPDNVEDTRRMMVQRYWLEPSNDNMSIFTCYPTLKMRFDSQPVDDIRKYYDDQILQLQRGINKPLRYTTKSLPQMTASLAKALTQERRERDIDDPVAVKSNEPIPRENEILELTSRFRAGLGPLAEPANRLAFAQRLCDYLRSDGGFTYRNQPPQVPRGAEPVGEFLFKSKTGHCEYFASALTLMCQLNDIPARIVVGYCGGDYNPVGNFYVVRQKHAHSWVEVFIPEMDWVTFDPTPADPTVAGSPNRFVRAITRYVDYVQFLWANLVVAYDAEQRRSFFEGFASWVLRPAQNENTFLGVFVAFVRELFGWRLKLNWQERLIYWVFAILVFVLAALVTYVLGFTAYWSYRKIDKFQQRRARRSDPPEIAFYTRFCHHIESWGVRRAPGQTPAEFAHDLANRYPVCAGAPQLVDAYYQVAFGGEPLTLNQQEDLDSFLGHLAPYPPVPQAEASLH